MKKLNILISHTSIYGKSGWGRTFPLARGLVNLGNDVTILTTSAKFSLFIRRVEIDNVKIIIFPEVIPSRISRMGFGFLSLFLKVWHVLFNKYDVVHSDNGHRPLSGIPCRVHKRIFRSIYVAEWYDWYGKGGAYDSKKKFFKLFFGRYELKYEIYDKKNADGVVVLSEVLRSRAEQVKAKNRIIKIHGGADVTQIPFIKNNNYLKKKYGIDENTLTLGYISLRTSNLEEFAPLINAISKLDDIDRVKILVYGDSSKLVHQIPLDYQSMFIFFGWVDYSTDYEKLQCTDVFFLFKEDTLGTKAGWPNCLGDYLACGRPVLINAVGETVDFVKKYSNVFFETTRDVDNIYDQLNNIINNNELSLSKREEARKIAEDVVSWDARSKELYIFYLHLLNLRNNSK